MEEEKGGDQIEGVKVEEHTSVDDLEEREEKEEPGEHRGGEREEE